MEGHAGKLMICDSVGRRFWRAADFELRIKSIWTEKSFSFNARKSMICDSVGRSSLGGKQILSLGLGRYGKAKSFMFKNTEIYDL